jgi:hypothetical protein
VKKPEAQVGQIVRFDYLWRDEQTQGRIEGAKDRPCAVVVALRTDEKGDASVMLAPITHAQPKSSSLSIEIPNQAKSGTGLDADRSWLVLSEINLVKWSDAGIVPAKSGQWLYGALPRGITAKTSAIVREELLKSRTKIVDRRENVQRYVKREQETKTAIKQKNRDDDRGR